MFQRLGNGEAGVFARIKRHGTKHDWGFNARRMGLSEKALYALSAHRHMAADTALLPMGALL